MSEGALEAIRFADASDGAFARFLADVRPGSVIELAPGRYLGPIRLTRAITIRGAGDLTCLASDARASVVRVDAGEDRVVLESLRLEGGDADSGGALRIDSGKVRLHNLHLQHCRAERGGAIDLAAGELDATLLRIEDVSAERGGAVWVHGRAALILRESQVSRSEAGHGGAFLVEDGARVVLEGLTVRRTRALSASGGQALYVAGSPEAVPTMLLRRVRFEDVPFGAPLIVDPAHPGEITLSECDMPRVVLSAPGVIDGGNNQWR